MADAEIGGGDDDDDDSVVVVGVVVVQGIGLVGSPSSASSM